MKFLRLFPVIAVLLLSVCTDQQVWDKVNDPDTVDDLPVYNISVVSVNPAGGSADVGINETVEVIFDDNIEMTTVNSGTFMMNSGTVSGNYTYSAADKRVIFTPSSYLSPGTTYSVVLTEGIKSLVGDSLAAQYAWNFTTAGASSSEITVLEDQTGVLLQSGDTFDTGTSTTGACTSYILVIRNDGVDNLTVSNPLTLAGTNSSEFSISDPSPLNLVMSGEAQFTVDFCPSSTGEKNAYIQINSNDSDENPFIINLYGVSLASAEPEFALYESNLELPSGNVYNFGNLPIGTSSSPVPFQIVNRGSANLTISGISINDPTGSFVINTGSMDFNLAPQESTSFTLTFTPVQTDKVTVQLTIGNNDSDENPFILTLMGKGR